MEYGSGVARHDPLVSGAWLVMTIGKIKSLPRVCILTGNFYPVVGGGERHAHLLGRELSCMGTRVVVVTRRRYRDMFPFETIDGFNVYRVAPTGFARIGKYLMILPAVFRLWKIRDEFDVIYVCGLRVLGIAGLLAGWITGKPCVLRAEARGEMDGEFIWKSPEGEVDERKKKICQPLIKLRNKLYLRAKCFLSISTPISEEFAATGVPSGKLAVIPNGLDLEMFHPVTADEKQALRKSLQLPAGMLFAYSGKLNRGKGLELLLRVWQKFSGLHPDARLILIGSGGGQHLSCESFLRDFVREHRLEKSVTFTGYVERVPDYLNAVDVFVFPSECESMGLAVLEALACKLPVIASRIPGVMDMVEDGVNGRLVDVKDEAAWLAAMNETVSQSSIYHQMAETGLETVKSTFSIAAVADQHIQLFRRLI